jgi:DNA polymerase sigma
MVTSMLQMRRRLERYRGITFNWGLGVLLLEFFNLYGGGFNSYHTGISLLEGGTYFRKREREGDWFNPSRYGFYDFVSVFQFCFIIYDFASCRANLLCIENPNEPELDMGRNSFMYTKVRRSFEHASQVLNCALSDCRHESYLSFIIRSDDKSLANRTMPSALSAAAATRGNLGALFGEEEDDIVLDDNDESSTSTGPDVVAAAEGNKKKRKNKRKRKNSKSGSADSNTAGVRNDTAITPSGSSNSSSGLKQAKR